MVQPVPTEGYDGREEAATLSLRRRMGNPANCALFQSTCLFSSLLSWIGARRRTIGGRDLERKRPVQAGKCVRCVCMSSVCAFLCIVVFALYSLFQIANYPVLALHFIVIPRPVA